MALIVRNATGTWMAPGVVFSGLWFVYSFVPLAFAFTVPAEPLALLYILSAITAFCASTPFFNWNVALRSCRNHASGFPVNYATRFMWGSFHVCCALAMVSLVVNSYIQKITIGDLVSNFFGSSAQYVGRRYSGELQDNVFIKTSNLFSYLTASLGGLIYSCAKKRNTLFWILFVSFLPSAFVMVTQSARGMLFLSIAMFAAAYMVARKGEKISISVNYKVVLKLIIYLLIVFVLIAVSFMAKGLHEEQDPIYVLDRLMAAFASYTMGHIYAFSDWFAFYINRPSVNMYTSVADTNGFYTFMAIFRIFGGDREVAPGVYEEYYQHGSYIATNIYTMFRGLIIDFGVVGSILFMACAGFLANLGFFYMMRSRVPVSSASFYVCAMGFYYTSFIISIMIWNSIFVTFLGLALILLINRTVSVSSPRVAVAHGTAGGILRHGINRQ
jgi:oligosaccharide repeat unit polymerase